MDNKIEHLIDVFEMQNKRIDKISDILERMVSDQFIAKRAKIEQSPEQIEQVLASSGMNRIRGRPREVLALFINQGFHSYHEIAEKLSISQSRARAYITELKYRYNIPLKQVKDPEGLKIGLDATFIEQILAFR